jgi:hypothetical protein
MLYREIIVVYSGNHTKPINTLYGKYAKVLNVKAGCKCFNTLVSKGW